MGAERWQAFGGWRSFTSQATPDSAPPAKAGKSGSKSRPYPPPFTVAVARRSSLPQPTRPPRAAVSTDLTTT